MAIAFDNSSHTNAESHNISFNHTVAGTNRLLLVFVNQEGTSGGISSVTYNSVSMTQLSSSPFVSGARTLFGYYLINPSTGTNAIEITNTITIGDDIDCIGLSYTGVKQTGFPDSGMITNHQASTAAPILSFTTVADNCWLVGMSATGNTPSAGANTTIRVSEGVADKVRGIDSGASVGTAGSYSLNLTQTAANSNMVGVSMAPAAVATTNAAFLLNLI